MKKVYLVNGVRSPIGTFLGSLKNAKASELGAALVKELLIRSKVSPEDIDEVIVGNVLSAGLGQGPARQIAVKAGIPVEKTAYSINMVCGSGMKAVMNAAQAAESDSLIVAGGVEIMSTAPFLVSYGARQGLKMGSQTMVDHMIYDSLTDAFNNIHMGVTAENIAKKYDISREEQDAFALNSQKKAIAAVDGGAFYDEIMPYEVVERKNSFTFQNDEHPNRTTGAEKLAKLRPAFMDGGTVTAGNASGINDGGSFVLVAGEGAVSKYSLKPFAELISFGQGGVDPAYMGLGPVPAIRVALKKAGLTLQDMDYIELNEAFAAQALGCVRELSAEHRISQEALLEKCNVNGGAIALGHPVGASGNRILVTLMHILKKKKAKLGLASLCIGGGMGTAVVIRNLNV